MERPGHTRSERAVGASFDELFKGCKERIIVTTFASNVDRIQQIINVAARYGRKVAVTGRSMENSDVYKRQQRGQLRRPVSLQPQGVTAPEEVRQVLDRVHTCLLYTSHGHGVLFVGFLI